MRASREVINLIKQFEGCRLDAYKCPAGKWTIGFGHTQGVKPGDKISQAQAEAYLMVDLERYEANVIKYDPKYNWTQNEFDALVCFAYNLGSIDGLVDNGKRTKAEIADAFLLYNTAKVNGVKTVLAGLTRRRKSEQALFIKKGTVSTMEINSVTPVTNASGISQYLLSQNANKAISKNFKLKEFRCKDGSDRVLVDEKFVREKLQAIRDYFRAPVTINSAYRTESYNAKIGGAKNSYHCKGQAFDISIKGFTPLEVARYAQSLGITGIIQYNTFVHVDSRPTKYWARNDNGQIFIKNSF